MRRGISCLPVVLAVSSLFAGTALAQDEVETPLSAIDWLSTQGVSPPGVVRTQPEPETATSALVPDVSVKPLQDDAQRLIGLVPPSVTGLPQDLWIGSDAERVISKIREMPELRLPAAQSLFYTVLLAEAEAPQGDPEAGEALALTRVGALMRAGALDPALALMEQIGVTQSPAHFDLWMEISLLAGTEDRACVVLRAAPHLTKDYGVRILCAMRDGRWEDAALTLSAAEGIGLMPEWRLALLAHFVSPETSETGGPPPAPRDIDPLSFRLFEAIGEPLPTRNLPRAYAVADLRDIAGWKAQLEAAERLTRAGALPDNHLLGLYTERKAAASGGVWDRVRALQNVDTALSSGSAEAVAKTLPEAWESMREAELEQAFAGMFAERLADVELSGRAGEIARHMGLLSANYEQVAQRAEVKDLPVRVALGDTSGQPSAQTRRQAIEAAFADAAPHPGLLSAVQEGRLGETILDLTRMLQEGAEGDMVALRDALATLRAIGLEDTARRVALQLLILEP
jgi:hypothetical protein